MNIYEDAVDFVRWMRARPWRPQTAPPAEANEPLFMDADGTVTPVRNLARAWHGVAQRSRLDQGIAAALRRDGYDADDETLSNAYAASVAAFACTQYRATSLAAIPPKVVDPAGEEVGWHPLGPFVDQARTLLWRLEVSRCIYGRAYLRKQYNRHGYPTGFAWLNPQWVRPDTRYNVETGEEELAGYWINQERALVSPEQVIFFPLFDPNDPYSGLAPLEIVMGQVAASRNLVRFAANFFWNSARPAGVLTSDDADRDETDEVRRLWAAGFKSVANHFKTFVTNKRWQFTPITYPPEDLAMDVLRNANNADVCAAFEVYAVLVGLKDVSDPLSAASTYEQVERNQTKNRTVPWLEDIYAQLNQQWAWTDFDLQHHFTLVPDLAAVDLLSDMTESRVTQVNALVMDGTMDWDEGRERVGLSARDEGQLKRDPTRPLTVWAGSGCTLDEFRTMVGLEPLGGPAGSLVNVGGQLIPQMRLAEVADKTADQAGQAPAAPFGGSPFAALPDIHEPLALPATVDEPLAQQLRELGNWARKVARSTPDIAFEPLHLRACPRLVQFVRESLERREDPDIVFWVARAWLETGTAPPIPAPVEASPEVTRQNPFEVSVTDITSTPDEPFGATPAQFERYWSRYDLLQADLGADWLAWLSMQAGQLSGAILSDPDPAKAEKLLDALDDDDAVGQLAATWIGTREQPGPLYALVLAGMTAGNEAINDNIPADQRSATRQLELTVSWDVMSREAWDFVQSYAFDLIKGINGTTREKVRKALMEWVESGAAMPALRQELSGIFQDAHRAQVIAQTESTRAYAEGSYQRYERAGVTISSWQTVRDEWVCPICRPLHGLAADFRQGWVHPGGAGKSAKYKGQTFRHPAHVGCRCFSRPVVTPGQRQQAQAEAAREPPAPRPPRPRGGAATAPSEDWEPILRAAQDWMRGQDETTAGRGGVPEFDFRVAQSAKDNIVKELERRTGLPYQLCNDFVKQWARTSNDDDWRSLGTQEVAAELFGTRLSPWQQQKADERRAKRIEDMNYATEWMEGENLYITEQNHKPDRGEVELAPGIAERYDTAEDALRALLNAMHDHTQEQLASANVDTVVLYRGVMLSADQASTFRELNLKDEVPDVVPLQSNVLESWSFDRRVAERFAKGEVGQGEVGVVLQIEVPRERIVGTARTGYGCLNEWEAVIHSLPEGDEALVDSMYNEFGDLVAQQEVTKEAELAIEMGGLVTDWQQMQGTNFKQWLEKEIGNHPDEISAVWVDPNSALIQKAKEELEPEEFLDFDLWIESL